MNWDLELFEYYQDNLQDYQTEINNLNSSKSKDNTLIIKKVPKLNISNYYISYHRA